MVIVGTHAGPEQDEIRSLGTDRFGHLRLCRFTGVGEAPGAFEAGVLHLFHDLRECRLEFLRRKVGPLGIIHDIGTESDHEDSGARRFYPRGSLRARAAVAAKPYFSFFSTVRIE